MKSAIIVGVKGQDGQLLFNHLVNNGYSVIGIDINYNISTKNNWENTISISRFNEVANLVKSVQPHEIYYLAAYHHSSEDKIENELELIINSYTTNVLSYVNFLEAVRQYSADTKLFYAASSLIFGNPNKPKQNENTIFNPKSIYSLTKYSGLKLSEYFREQYSLFISVGILYNHESHLRPVNFVSKKIVKTAVEIKNNIKNKLHIGNIDADIDWGYAGDFVEAFVKILSCEKPNNFIVSTGQTYKLKNFIIYVFSYLDLDWKKHVVIDENLLTRKSINNLCGDNTKISEITGWRPKHNLEDLAKLMVDKEIEEFDKNQ